MAEKIGYSWLTPLTMPAMHRPDLSKRKPSGTARPAQMAQPRVEKPAAPINKPGSLSESKLYINRELSQLEFQWRVFQQATIDSMPLLERFKFLAIVGSNLEEFFMVRVAGLKRQLESNTFVAGADGLTPQDQLDAINKEVVRLLTVAHDCMRDQLLPALKQADVHVLDYQELTPEQKAEVDDYFVQTIFPVLTPLAFDPGHPFPHISNLSTNLAVFIRDPEGEERFARVKIPDTLPQIIHISESPESDPQPHAVAVSKKRLCYIWLDELVRANLEVLFPGMTILDAHTFHVIRDADVEIQEWEADDLLEATEEGVRQRRFGDVVRLQVNRGMPAEIVDILTSNLQVEPNDVYIVESARPLSSLKYIAAIDRYDLKFQPFVPTIPNGAESRRSGFGHLRCHY